MSKPRTPMGRVRYVGCLKNSKPYLHSGTLKFHNKPRHNFLHIRKSVEVNVVKNEIWEVNFHRYFMWHAKNCYHENCKCKTASMHQNCTTCELFWHPPKVNEIHWKVTGVRFRSFSLDTHTLLGYLKWRWRRGWSKYIRQYRKLKLQICSRCESEMRTWLKLENSGLTETRALHERRDWNVVNVFHFVLVGSLENCSACI